MSERPALSPSPTPLALWPRSVERPADAGATLVAGIDGDRPALVDGGGLVSPTGATWSLDWWIGGDDRWYLPAREPSVRQRRIGDGPVIETSVRVPSGDVVATTWPVVAGGHPATVVEIHNDSPVPVALALALRPYPVDGRVATDHRLALSVDRRRVEVDGRPAVLLPRPPNEAGADGAADLLERVVAGEPLSWSGPVEGPGANAVCLYPVPHATSLRVTLPGPGPRPTEAATVDRLRPEAVPDAEAVARGWTSVIEQGGTFRFPDPGLTALTGAARSRLILAAPELPDRLDALEPGAGTVLEALAAGGHAGECRPAVERLAAGFPTGLPAGVVAGAEAVAGVAAAADLFGEVELAERLLAPAMQLTHLVERSGDRVVADRARRGLARLAILAGQRAAARHLRPEGPAPAAAPDLEGVLAMVEQAAPAGRWNATAETADGAARSVDGAVPAASFWLAARRLLVDEADGDVAVRLLPVFPTAWLGGGVEVHRAPAAGVRVSFAIRWHGYRPALLWEVEGARGAVGGIRLTAPGLDPDWSTDEPRGEALLSGSAVELPGAPGPGDSFL